jgi:hypothetical protein
VGFFGGDGRTLGSPVRTTANPCLGSILTVETRAACRRRIDFPGADGTVIFTEGVA